MKNIFYIFLVFVSVGIGSSALYCYEEKEPEFHEGEAITRFKTIYENYTLKEKTKELPAQLNHVQVVSDALILAENLPVRLALISHKIGATAATSLVYTVGFYFCCLRGDDL